MRILPLVLCLVAAGCAGGPKDIVTAELVIQHGTNVFRLKQPKDTTLKKASIDPFSGRVELEEYSSVANAGAVTSQRAQADFQNFLLQSFLQRADQRIDQVGVPLARTYGVPLQPLAPLPVFPGTNQPTVTK